MKEIKLFVDFEFTSLSPDAQPISVGIVSEDIFNSQYRALYSENFNHLKDKFSVDHGVSKSFYAEFTDFDINRCDDWVKENVVSRLQSKDEIGHAHLVMNNGNLKTVHGNTDLIKESIKSWLSQFSDYRIQFVVDCGTWDWYWLLQLLAEWDITQKLQFSIDAKYLTQRDIDELNEVLSDITKVIPERLHAKTTNLTFKVGLPKLPSNISPVPIDLNDMIAHNRGISASEAFELNREELATGVHSDIICNGSVCAEDGIQPQKHNALWDAKVMLSIYNSFLNKRQFVFLPK